VVAARSQCTSAGAALSRARSGVRSPFSCTVVRDDHAGEAAQRIPARIIAARFAVLGWTLGPRHCRCRAVRLTPSAS
jgi:hypothetical protein